MLKGLEKLGMKLISGKKHWKLEYGNVRFKGKRYRRREMSEVNYRRNGQKYSSKLVSRAY